MTSDDQYGAWKRQRSRVDVDTRFADRVMERIGERGLSQPRRAEVLPERRPCGVAWRVQVAASVLVVGLSVGLMRAGSLIAFLLLNTSRGY